MEIRANATAGTLSDHLVRTAVPLEPKTSPAPLEARFPVRRERAQRHFGETLLGAEDLRAVAHCLETIPTALLLLDGCGGLVFVNHEAERLLADKDAILVDQGGIFRCRNREAELRLRCLMTDRARADVGPGPGTPTVFAIPRTAGRPLAGLLVRTPSRASGDPGVQARESARLVLLLRDPERIGSDTGAWLEPLYGLSQAEANVAARLAAGADLKEIASERDVSLATVRNQLKSAHAKVGVSRQAELVSLMLRTTQF